jgi:hypothetical protein
MRPVKHCGNEFETCQDAKEELATHKHFSAQSDHEPYRHLLVDPTNMVRIRVPFKGTMRCEKYLWGRAVFWCINASRSKNGELTRLTIGFTDY